MSVEKVNKYKEEKANRKEILEQQKKKAKQTRAALVAGTVVVVALIVGAIGITVRNEYKAYQNAKPNYSTTQMLAGDLAGVLQDETEAETQEGDAKETQATTEG